MRASELAQQHWNETPLFISAEKRYSIYPWLPAAAEFAQHRGERVLEIGCGTGCDLQQFAKHGAQVFGVDITEKHVELAKERLQGMGTVMLAEGANLPFPDGFFDYVYSHGVIHHSDHPREIIEEMFRVLKPEGRFNIQLYAAHSYNLWRAKSKFPDDWMRRIENSTAPVHIDFYSNQAARELVAPARDVKVRKIHCSVSLKGLDLSRLFQPFGRWLGYYVVVTGRKPAVNMSAAA